MIDQVTESLIERERNHGKKVSIIVGVVTKKDKMIAGKMYDDTGEVEMGDRVFEIGSITKTFTSLLLSKLVLNHTIALDEPISTFKPEYKNALSYNGKEVTFRHLSTHRSGFPREDTGGLRKRIKEQKEGNDNPYKHYTHPDLHQFFIDFDLKKEIDKKWKYSNIAIGLLGNILAELLGSSYDEAVTSQILHPLGMKHTFVTRNQEQNSRYISAYNKKGESIQPFSLPAMNGAGGLKSTMNDMLQYIEHQMGMLDSPLKNEIELTHGFHAKTPWKNFDMGLGWFMEQKKWSEFPIIHHDGRTMGFQTYCGFMKEKQIGIVISSTVQLNNIRLIKILLNLAGMANENIAEAIFKYNVNEPG